MKKNDVITVKDVRIKTIAKNGIDYICITDIARQKNAREPKDVVKHWMRQKNTLEYLGLWERLYNPFFKGAEFGPLLAQAGIVFLKTAIDSFASLGMTGAEIEDNCLVCRFRSY